MKCGYAKAKDGTRFWFPQCMGGAAMGLHYCTCGTPSFDAQYEIACLKRRVVTLENQQKNA